MMSSLLWSLSAGAAAGCCCHVGGRVRFGAWVLVPLQGSAPKIFGYLGSMLLCIFFGRLHDDAESRMYTIVHV